VPGLHIFDDDGKFSEDAIQTAEKLLIEIYQKKKRSRKYRMVKKSNKKTRKLINLAKRSNKKNKRLNYK